MDTKIIYEVNEDFGGIAKDWSVRILGVFDNVTLVEFCDGQGVYAVIEGGVYSEKLQKVTLKFTKSIHTFAYLSEAINKFAAEISWRRFNSAL